MVVALVAPNTEVEFGINTSNSRIICRKQKSAFISLFETTKGCHGNKQSLEFTLAEYNCQ